MFLRIDLSWSLSVQHLSHSIFEAVYYFYSFLFCVRTNVAFAPQRNLPKNKINAIHCGDIVYFMIFQPKDS